MAELPFLVVHGALVWKAGLVGAGALTVRLARLRRDLKSAKFVRRATQHYTSTATGLEAGPILLRGRLRGGSAQSYEHTYCPVVHTRDAGVYFDVEGERIDFDGEIVVGCGSEIRTSYWRPPAGAPKPNAEIAKYAKLGAQRLSIARADDEVLISGVLRRAASGDTAYRESAGSWMIEPFPRQGAVGLVAVKHRARAMPATPLAMTMAFAISALVMLVGMRACGSLELGGYGTTDAHIRDLSIASAMPGTRDNALDELARVLDDARTPDRIDQAIQLRRIQHGCGAAIDLMFEESRLEEALDASRSCGLRSREVDALLLLGRFDEAATSPSLQDAGDDERVVAALAAGHWAEAAAIEPDHCASLLYAAYADPGAAKALRDEVARTGDERCAVLATQLLPADQRRDALLELTLDHDAPRVLAATMFPVFLSEDNFTIDNAARELATGDYGVLPMSVWTSHRGDQSPARAVYEVYAGNFKAAQEIAGVLVAGARSPQQEAEAGRLAALIAMRAGEPVRPEWLQHGDALPPGSVFLDDDLGAPFVIAQGSAPTLARGSYGLSEAMNGGGAFLRQDYNELRLGDGVKLLAVLPAIKTDRATATDFMLALHGDTLDAREAPLQVIRAAAMRRDLARAAGATDVATSWQGVIDRHLAVIAQPQRLLALFAHHP